MTLYFLFFSTNPMSNEKVYCDFHPGSEARWYCVDCHHYLCQSCVEERRLSRRFKAYVHSLEECRGKCVPLNAVLKQASAVKALTPSLIREPKPSFLTRHYQWRFYLGLAGVCFYFLYQTSTTLWRLLYDVLPFRVDANLGVATSLRVGCTSIYSYYTRTIYRLSYTA